MSSLGRGYPPPGKELFLQVRTSSSRGRGPPPGEEVFLQVRISSSRGRGPPPGEELFLQVRTSFYRDSLYQTEVANVKFQIHNLYYSITKSDHTCLKFST
jgi:hypothetical protein